MMYEKWITITISHTYFKSGNCGVELKETASTGLLMKKAGILFRKQDPTTWVLLKARDKHNGLPVEDNLLKLDFDLLPLSSEFYYYTRWEKPYLKGDGWVLRNQRNTCREKKYLQLRIPSFWTNETKNIHLTIPSGNAFWEFILIPKYSTGNYPVELKESTANLNFSEPEEIPVPGEAKAFRSITTSPIPMRNTYNYKISLWEIREKGKLVLINRIPYPQPDSRSVTNPKETITGYFYY